MKSILVSFFLTASLFGQTAAVPLSVLAEQVLSASQATSMLRTEAAWILRSDRQRSMGLADQLAKGGLWTSQLSALSLWSMAGPQTVVDQAIARRKLHLHNNWFIRKRVLEGLTGGGALIPLKVVLHLLHDPNWAVRCAALALIPELREEERSTCYPILATLIEDEDPQVRHLALETLIRLAATDGAVCASMLQIDWQESSLEFYQKRVLFSLMDASASGLISLRPFDDFPAVQTLYERVERVLLSQPSADRVGEVIGILRDPVGTANLGDHLARALFLFVAQDPGWPTMMPGRFMGQRHYVDLLTKLIRDGWTPSLKSGVLGAACGMEDMGQVLLEEAWRQEAPDMVSTLDGWFQSLVKQHGKYQQLHQVLEFRKNLQAPLDREMLLTGLREGESEITSLVTAFMWTQGSKEDRMALMATLGNMKIAPRLMWGILKSVALDPKPESNLFNLKILKDETQRTNSRRIVLNALQQMDVDLDIDLLLKIRPRDGSTFDREVTQILVKRGHLPTIARVLAELKETPGKEIERALIDVVSLCANDDAISYLKREFLKGNFGQTNLVSMLTCLRTHLPADEFFKLLNDAIRIALDEPSEKLRETGFEGMNGNVLGRLFAKFGDAIDLKILFQLVLKRNGFQTLSNLQEVAGKQGQTKVFTKLLMESWQDFVLSSGNIYGVLDFARVLIRSGDPHAKALVLDWVATREEDWLALGLASSAGWKGAALLDEVLSDLFARGDEASMTSALTMICRYERFSTRTWFQTFLQGGDGKLADDLDPDSFLVGTLGGLGDSGANVARFKRAFARMRKESKSEYVFPVRFWQHWARQVVQAPKAFQPTDLIAKKVLSIGPKVFSGSALLMALGRRGMNTWGAKESMEVFSIGHQLTQGKQPGKGKKPQASFKAWNLKKLDPNQVFWTAQRVKTSRSKAFDLQILQLNHRFSDQEIARLVRDLRDFSFDEKANELLVKGRSLGRASGIWDALELRRLLDEEAFEEALNLAHHSLRTARVFRSYERFGTAEEFLIFEAAALWGLDRKTEARQKLKEARTRSIEQLSWIGPKDFPGFDGR